MRATCSAFCLAMVAISSALAAGADGPLPLRVLYLARNDEGDRTEAFVSYLNSMFEQAETVPRSDFDPKQADEFDVVLLDWSQQERTANNYPSPLGDLADWSHPTVLLGSGTDSGGAMEHHRRRRVNVLGTLRVRATRPRHSYHTAENRPKPTTLHSDTRCLDPRVQGPGPDRSASTRRRHRQAIQRRMVYLHLRARSGPRTGDTVRRCKREDAEGQRNLAARQPAPFRLRAVARGTQRQRQGIARQLHLLHCPIHGRPSDCANSEHVLFRGPPSGPRGDRSPGEQRAA